MACLAGKANATTIFKLNITDIIVGDCVQTAFATESATGIDKEGNKITITVQASCKVSAATCVDALAAANICATLKAQNKLKEAVRAIFP